MKEGRKTSCVIDFIVIDFKPPTLDLQPDLRTQVFPFPILLVLLTPLLSFKVLRAKEDGPREEAGDGYLKVCGPLLPPFFLPSHPLFPPALRNMKEGRKKGRKEDEGRKEGR